VAIDAWLVAADSPGPFQPRFEQERMRRLREQRGELNSAVIILTS